MKAEKIAKRKRQRAISKREKAEDIEKIAESKRQQTMEIEKAK